MALIYEAPIEWFNLFYTPEILATITKHMNEYATYHRHVDHSQRPWQPLCINELQVFLGVVIYIGIYKCPQLEDYWNSDLENGPIHTVALHMSLVRFAPASRAI